MDLHQLLTFRTVAQTLSFTRSADILGYAQSSVTAQIQSLEADLKVPLFNRLGRRVSLTEAGVRLLTYADRIISLCDEAEQAVTHNLEISGTLAISAPESVCTYRLPAILHAFQTAWPGIRLTFRPLAMAAIYTALRDSVIDLALLLEGANSPTNLETITLSSEPLCLIAAPNHALTRVDAVTAHGLQGENLLLTERGCQYRTDFEQSLQTMGVRSATTLEFASIEAIKQCTIAGLGVAYLPQMTVIEALAARQLVVLAWPERQMSLNVAWHKDKWLSPAAHAFLDVCRLVYGVQSPQTA